MKNYYLKAAFLFFSLTVVLSSCDSELISDEDTTPVPVTFSLDFNQPVLDKSAKTTQTNGEVTVDSAYEVERDNHIVIQPKTAWGTSSNVTTWAAGDKVGVFMRHTLGANAHIDRSNMLYTVNTAASSSSLTASAPLYYPLVANDRVNLYAYYPYAWVSTSGNISTSAIQFADAASTNSTVLSYVLPTNQSTQQALRDADIMCASVLSANRASSTVPLSFSHKMVLLTFRVNSTLLPSTLSQVTLSGSSITNTGTLNLATGTLTPNTSTPFSPSVTLNAPIGLATYAFVDFLINPCTFSGNGSSTQLKVTLTVGGQQHSTNVVNSATFVGGTRYVYNLSVLLSIL